MSEAEAWRNSGSERFLRVRLQSVVVVETVYMEGNLLLAGAAKKERDQLKCALAGGV